MINPVGFIVMIKGMRKLVCGICVLILALMSAQDTLAQDVTNNNAIITISPGTRMTVFGGVLNNGDLTNNGMLSISGDWMNADTYNPGNGIFILNGAGTQNIAHSAQDIYQLEISGGGEKIFSSDVQVTDTLFLLDGLVTPQSGIFFQVMSGGSIAGGSDQSYVNGALFHEGTGFKYFPIGKNGNYRPVELMNVSGSNPAVGFEMFEPNSNPQVPLTLLAISDTRYWQLIRRSGTYDGSVVKLKVTGDENLGTVPDLQDLVVTSADRLDSIFNNLGQSLFSGTLQDGELTSNMPAIREYYALGVEGVDEERNLYVPNALSPAAPDPEDRVIKVYSDQVMDSDFMFRIYNRWGKIVYETDSFTEANTLGWSGADPDELESVGVYQYTLTGRFISGNTFKRNGSITLIR